MWIQEVELILIDTVCSRTTGLSMEVEFHCKEVRLCLKETQYFQTTLHPKVEHYKLLKQMLMLWEMLILPRIVQQSMEVHWH